MANYNLRAITATLCHQVVEQGRSLTDLLPEQQSRLVERDRPLLQELCFGLLRTLPLLEWTVDQLMARPFTGKQRPLHYLLLVGIYQLYFTRIPAHAALAETVQGAVSLKRPQLKAVINGVLRQVQRQQTLLLERANNHQCRYWHPQWLITKLQQHYPEQWQQIIDANNQPPPMWLRVNHRQCSTENYQQQLQEKGIESVGISDEAQALRLAKPCPVQQLPNFANGAVSVQDLSAQRCARLLDVQPGETILDLCAAPGGKTCHIAELTPQATLWAVDLAEKRLQRLKDNLHRLKLNAKVITGDACHPEQWCPPAQQFDRILVDAPCSASGVIRRHPDIKWLKQATDIQSLVALQQQILCAIWPYLKVNGTLLYATCSLLPEENQQQIAHFLAIQSDAQCVPLIADQPLGWQVLPQIEGGDGFYYAKLVKKSG